MALKPITGIKLLAWSTCDGSYSERSMGGRKTIAKWGALCFPASTKGQNKKITNKRMGLIIIAILIGLGLGAVLAIPLFFGVEAGIKRARREADAIIAAQKGDAARINKLIDTFSNVSNLYKQPIPEEDKERMEKLRKVRDKNK